MSDLTDLTDLYQEIILEHNRSPRNFRELPEANRRANGHNPLCGDRVALALAVQDEAIREVAFQGSGCAISTASASLLTEAVRGLPLDEAKALSAAFCDRVTGVTGADSERDLGKLEALVGVREFPMRVKCATLPWRALEAAIASGDAPVSTE